MQCQTTDGLSCDLSELNGLYDGIKNYHMHGHIWCTYTSRNIYEYIRTVSHHVSDASRHVVSCAEADPCFDV